MFRSPLAILFLFLAISLPLIIGSLIYQKEPEPVEVVKEIPVTREVTRVVEREVLVTIIVTPTPVPTKEAPSSEDYYAEALAILMVYIASLNNSDLERACSVVLSCPSARAAIEITEKMEARLFIDSSKPLSCTEEVCAVRVSQRVESSEPTIRLEMAYILLRVKEEWKIGASIGLPPSM